MTNLSPTPPVSQAAPQVIFVLRISDGSFATGFSATLDILEPGRINPPQKYLLPAFADLPEAYTKWQKNYSDLSNSSGAPAGNTRTIQPVMGQIIQHSYAECQSACKQATVAFEDICLKWFAQPTFEALRRSIVSDRVVRYFLEYFLEEFSQSKITLQAAFRVARERLQWLESDGLQACPAATWLPIICQNPNQFSLL
jgi:hypothetical protein